MGISFFQANRGSRTAPVRLARRVELPRKQGVKRVVYAASSSAYGTASDPAGQCENTPLNPLSPYAAAKLAGEHYLEAYAKSFGVETVRLRFFNIFGPRQRADSPYSGVIAIFTGIMTAGRVPIVHGDGLQVRDFVYIENCVQAILKAIQDDAPPEQIVSARLLPKAEAPAEVTPVEDVEAVEEDLERTVVEV